MLNIGIDWMKKYPFKSRTLLFAMFFLAGVAILPSQNTLGVDMNLLYHLRILLANGFAASAGVQLSYFLIYADKELKRRSRNKRMEGFR